MITAILLLTVLATNAQLKNAILKKAGDKLKGNNDNSQPANQNNTNTNTNTNTTNTQNTNTSTFSLGGKKEIRAIYNFQQNTLMEMRSYDKKGELKKDGIQKMRFHFSTDPYNGIEPIDQEKGKAAFSIFENDKNQIVSLMNNDGNKMAVVTKMNVKISSTSEKDNKKNDTNEQPTITKTGRTKTICNYLCEEWTSVSKEGDKSEMWISKDVPLSMNGSFAMFSAQNRNMNMGDMSNYPQGYMMEITNYDNNGEKFTMTCLEVNLQASKLVETAGYTVY